MKLKSVSGYACYVKDLNVTARFYKTLGLTVSSRDAHRLTIYLNGFRIDFVTTTKDDEAEFQNEYTIEPKGAGIFLFFSVDDVDETYAALLAKGLNPAGKPKNQPWGNREFVIRDPDGYKLVIFKKN